MSVETKRDDGGPAFPSGQYTDGFDNAGEPVRLPTHPGMSLRDWFAGQALAGLRANPELTLYESEMARRAYVLADAMLAAREQEVER